MDQKDSTTNKKY